MKGYVALQTGQKFAGNLHHYDEQLQGEVVFYTGMTGYEGILTDPSTKGKIVVFTYPLIGSCGISGEYSQEKVYANGFIVHELVEQSSHYEAKMTLHEFSEQQNIPYMTNVDTRALVKAIRENGSTIAQFTEGEGKVEFSNEAEDLVEQVSIKKSETHGNGEEHIVLVDYGYKRSLLKSLINKKYKVTIVPFNTTFEEIKQLRPHTVIYSNGPGHPATHKESFAQIKRTAEAYPTFGIGLGHQLIALAFGGNVTKAKYGHHSITEPVIDCETNKVYMTTQNHNYVVEDTGLNECGFNIRFSNVNDKSIEGLVHTEHLLLTMQFHPISSPGSTDAETFFYSMLQSFISKGREKVYA